MHRLAAAASGLLAACAVAQPLPPSAAERSAAAMPLRVVCLADSPEAFLREDWFRERVLVPLADPGADGKPDPRSAIRLLGVRYMVALGAGFVVDAARRHVVTSWQVVAACTGEPGSGRRIAVVEAGQPPGQATGQPPGQATGPPPGQATGRTTGQALAADPLPGPPASCASARPPQPVQALCRDSGVACDAGLAGAAGERAPRGAERRRQLDNLFAYVPDLAVLRLAAAAATPPLVLALDQPLDDQMRLVVRAFDRGAQALAPASVSALYTGPQQFSSRADPASPQRTLQARLHRLAMPLRPSAGGAPVLRSDGVVGVLSVMHDAPPSSADASGLGTSHAVPARELAALLALLQVPYLSVEPEALLRPAAASTAAAATPGLAVAARSSPHAEPGARRWMLVGAAALAMAAAFTFFLLAWRQRASVAPAPDAAPPPAASPSGPGGLQRTQTRRKTTVLHAVAMPTSAIEAPPAAVPPPVRLVGSRGPLDDAVFTLPLASGSCTLYLGRDPRSCQVVFPDSAIAVSDVHACLTWDPPGRVLALRDLSRNGTWVNGRRVEQGQTLALASGDCIDLGGPELYRFTIEIAPACAENGRDDEPTP